MREQDYFVQQQHHTADNTNDLKASIDAIEVNQNDFEVNEFTLERNNEPL